jgi:LuxR family maltose regulon positive regulatory protein
MAELPTTDASGEPIMHSSQDLLEQLYHTNMFLSPVDEEHQWYRYHRLFAELLQAQLREKMPALEPSLHRGAATWLEENGLSIDAVQHALASRDYPFAADMIHGIHQQVSTWSSIDVATLQTWLAALPQEILKARPRLRLLEARAFCSTGNWENGIEILGELEDTIQAEPVTPDGEQLLNMVLADQASIAATKGELQQAIAHTQRIQERMFPEDKPMNMRVLVTLGMAWFRAGEVNKASDAFSQAISIARQVGPDFIAVPLVCNLVDVRIVEGKLRQALELCEQALQMGTVNGKQLPISGYVELELGKIYYEKNELALAQEKVLDGLEHLRQGGIADNFGSFHLQLALIKLALGDLQGAQKMLHICRQIVAGYHIPRLNTLVAACQARIWLAQGKSVLASDWGREYRQSEPTEYLRELEDLALAQVWLAEKQPNQALPVLEDLLSAATAAGRCRSVIHAQALKALAHWSTGGYDHAIEILEQTLIMARPEGFIQPFMEGGGSMQQLLSEAAKRGILPEYIRELLSRFERYEDAQSVEMLAKASQAHQSAASALVDPLTPREMEVLQLLEDGLSNAEICQQLYISMPTVKSHTRNIYGKLGVHNRKDAVTQARVLGILSDNS